MRQIKFRAFGDSTIGKVGTKEMHQWEQIKECFDVWLDDDYSTIMQFTGLLDKNDKDIYFNSDILEINNYEYREPCAGDGFYKRKCDLRFILKNGLLRVEYELINPPKGLNNVSLDVIFNLPNKNGNRIYIDNYRKSIEVIGNIHQNPDLLK